MWTLEVRAIHAHRVAALLVSAEPAPWRTLLWLALHSVCMRNELRGVNLLGHHWTDSDFTATTLGSDLLIAWAALQPMHAPAAPRASRWELGAGARAHVAHPPAMPDCRDIVTPERLRARRSLTRATLRQYTP